MRTSALQFSLKQLLLAVTLYCVAVSIIVWDLFWGMILIAGIVSVTLTVLGLRKRRKSLVACGVGVFVVIGGAILYCSTVVAWVGSRKLDVYVRVIDTDTFQPVANARIEVLDGPFSPLEGPVYAELISEFTPATMEPGSGALTTDSRGHCKFTHRFFAAGTDGPFRRSGYIDTGRTWLKVTAQGRGSVMLPMDRQSIRPRDINDKNPLFVTVPLRRQSEN